MKTTLRDDALDPIINRLCSAASVFEERFPGLPSARQPVHVIYGGAHLFNSETPAKLGRLAVKALEENLPDAQTLATVFGVSNECAAIVYERVSEKLGREPIEDLRVDFEDGYGFRSDAEEDGHAVSAAEETARAMESDALPHFFGIRIKALSPEARLRSIRTLDIYLTKLIAAAGSLPDNFVVMLPKVVGAVQVSALADIFDELESRLRLPAGALMMEIMIETVQSVLTRDGRCAMPLLLDAANGRLRGAHFGAYDYTASCGITSAHQDMQHQACDFVRNMMQVAFAGTAVWLSDGATNIMPVGLHRGAGLTEDQRIENCDVVHHAWRVHYDHCRSSLANGFYQSWDLHPAQLVSRYAAVYSFFLEGLDDASVRLKNFIDKAARSTMAGNTFDDAATGQGLLLFFLRAINCGALTETEMIERTGLTLDELRSGSFLDILGNRRV